MTQHMTYWPSPTRATIKKLIDNYMHSYIQKNIIQFSSFAKHQFINIISRFFAKIVHRVQPHRQIQSSIYIPKSSRSYVIFNKKCYFFPKTFFGKKEVAIYLVKITFDKKWFIPLIYKSYIILCMKQCCPVHYSNWWSTLLSSTQPIVQSCWLWSNSSNWACTYQLQKYKLLGEEMTCIQLLVTSKHQCSFF